MKKIELVVRLLLGALFLFASITFLLNLFPQPELSGELATFMTGLMAAKYLLPIVKVTELLCGLAFVTGFFVPLAVIVIFPISINILMVHIFLEPTELPVAIFVMASNLYLAYTYRYCYKGFLKAKVDD